MPFNCCLTVTSACAASSTLPASTEDALNAIFLAVDGVGGEILELREDYNKTTQAIEDNETALERWKFEWSRGF